MNDARPPADLLLVHAGELLTARTRPGGAWGPDLEALEVIADGAVAVTDGTITDVGSSRALQAHHRSLPLVDVAGRLVTPGFVDCHAHLVHGGSRHAEYERKIRGLPPTTEATGIAATVGHTAATADDELRRRAQHDLDVMLAHGTTTTEAKSGYGGGADGELRLLRLTSELSHPVTIVPTFLGAHAVPPEWAHDRNGFIDEIIGAMQAARSYAGFFDVFCDPLGFEPAEARRLSTAAIDAGFALKVHADQTADVGATRFAADAGAISIDHLDYASPEAITACASAGSVAVLLPGVAHHLGELTPDATGTTAKPHLPAQAARLITAGAVMALSTDYNPGTSPTRSMQTVLELAVRLLRLPAAAAWHMATINAAHGLGVAGDRGSLEIGKAADLVVWEVDDHRMVTNRFGTNHVHAVYKGGHLVTGPRD